MMSKCDTCGQELPEKVRLDAIGREIDVHSVLLYLEPVYHMHVDGIRMQFEKSISDNPLIVRQVEVGVQMNGEYIIRAINYMDTSMSLQYEINGECGVRNPRIYKLSDSLGDMP